MPVSLVQEVSVVGGGSTVQTLFAAVEGNLAIVALLSSIDTPAPTVLINGQVTAPAFTLSVQSDTSIHVLIFRIATSGDQILRILAAGSTTPFLIWMAEFADEAQIPPYVAELRSGINTTPATKNNWDAPALGIAYLFFASYADTAGTFALPAGWTSTATTEIGLCTLWVAFRPITVTGAQAEETFASGTPGFHLWRTLVLGLFDVGLRARSAGAFASAVGGSLSTPGYVEPPVDVIPFEPDVNPLPPDPSPIVVPLPPYIPGTGPYRPS